MADHQKEKPVTEERRKELEIEVEKEIQASNKIIVGIEKKLQDANLESESME